MGIADRNYMNDRRPTGGGTGSGFDRMGRLRFLSVNAWIIILCVGIFVLDSFLPHRWVNTGKITLLPGVENVDRSQMVMGDVEREVTDVPIRTVNGVKMIKREKRTQPIFASDGGPRIGTVHLDEMHFIESFLYLSTARIIFGVEFWRLLGFQFLHSHASITHLLFNMLGLYFFGPLVEQWLGGKRYLAFYLLCGIAGALVYLFLNVLGIAAAQMFGPDFRIPGLLFHDLNTPLIGASAGVFGVIMAGAYLAPTATVLLFFVLPMRLATLAYILVGVAVAALLFDWQNAGGQAAHLGGAVAGWYLIRRPRHLHGFFDVLGRVDPTSRSAKARRAGKSPRAPDRTETDRILDKISTSGLASLTEREKRLLREASGRD